MKRIFISLIILIAAANPIWAQESIVYETKEMNESFQVIDQDKPIILHQDYIILDDYRYTVTNSEQKYVTVNGSLSTKRIYFTDDFSVEVLEKIHGGKDLLIYRHNDDVRIFVSSQRKIRVEENGTLVTSNN